MEKGVRDFEKTRDRAYRRAVTNSMKVNDDDSLIVQYIKEHTPESQSNSRTGIDSKCYPILRSLGVTTSTRRLAAAGP